MNESELRKGLEQAGRQAIPPTVDLWPSVQSRLRSRQDTYQAAFRLKVIGATLIAIIVLAALAFLLKPQQVSAAEILNRALQVTQNAAAFGVQSYQGVIDQTHDESGFSDLVTHWQGHVWVQSPDRFRIERFGESPYVYPSRIPSADIKTLSAAVPPLNVDKAEFSDLAVSDGVITWELDPGFNDVVEYEAADYEAQTATAPFYLFFDPNLKNLTDIRDVIQQLAPDYKNVILRQDTTIAGRSAYAVQLALKAADLSPSVLSLTFWIDRNTFLFLGYEERSTTGTVLSHAAFTTLQVNIPINPSAFQFTPPPKATLSDLRPRFPTSQVELNQAWQRLKAQWGDYPLYAPTNVPPSFVSDLPQILNEPEPLFFSPPNAVQRFYAYGIHMITITQSIGRFENYGTGPYTVQVGPYTGEYLGVPDRPKTLILRAVDQNDVRTNFLITADASVSKDELLKIAASLQEIAFDKIAPLPPTF